MLQAVLLIAHMFSVHSQPFASYVPGMASDPKIHSASAPLPAGESGDAEPSLPPLELHNSATSMAKPKPKFHIRITTESETTIEEPEPSPGTSVGDSMTSK